MAATPWGTLISSKPTSSQAEALELFMAQITSPRGWYAKPTRVHEQQQHVVVAAKEPLTHEQQRVAAMVATDRACDAGPAPHSLSTVSIRGSKLWGPPGVQTHRWWSLDEQDSQSEDHEVKMGAAGRGRPFHR